MKTNYREIEITYDENSNDWNCDLFSKPAESLATAKARIDKKLDEEKKAPFAKFDVFITKFGFGGESYPLVTVTSICEGGKQAWVSLNGERQKVGSNYGNSPIPIYPNTSENAAIVAEIHGCETAMRKLNQRIGAAQKQLTLWKP